MTDSALDPGCPNTFVSYCLVELDRERGLTLPDRISSALSSEQSLGWGGGWLGLAGLSDNCY